METIPRGSTPPSEGETQPDIINQVPGVTGTEPQPPPEVQEPHYFGGYTGSRLSAPVLGLPAGMTREQARVQFGANAQAPEANKQPDAVLQSAQVSGSEVRSQSPLTKEDIAKLTVARGKAPTEEEIKYMNAARERGIHGSIV